MAAPPEPEPLPRGVQVEPSHYDFERYDDAERWMSYWHQLRAVLAVRPRRVLEIGTGTGVFRRTLEHAGVAVTTVDLDPSRRPDHVADLRELDTALPAGDQFDAVCAFQVLEHLPLADFDRCLAQLARRAAPHLFLSLPYRGLRIRLSFWWGDHHITAGHKFMLPWRHTPIPEHHWELGYPLTARKITRRIAAQLDVVSRGFIRDNPYHYLWQLRRRETG